MANETKTILNSQRRLEGAMDVNQTNDTHTTLNRKYNISPNEVLAAGTVPKIQFFGIGINGYRNISDTNDAEPHQVLMDNMDLYQPIPIRMRPIENDLTPEERANYRMRVIQSVDGGSDLFACYYLKRLEVLDDAVNFTIKDSEGVETPYEMDYSKLTPTPPVPSVGGVNQAAQDQITVSVDTRAIITGNEVHEAINYMFGGNLNKARISEIGIYQGQDRTTAATDYLNNTFNYQESIMTQMVFHRTWTGDSVETPGAVIEYIYSVQSETAVLAS